MTLAEAKPETIPPDVSVALIATQAEARAATDVLAVIWPQPGGMPPLSPELAWAMAHAGNYVSVARLGDRVVGAAVAFRGVDGNEGLLHSHIAGVLPRCQGSSIGFALKQHQARWAAEQGLRRILWTFDPLVGRNGYFNVMKLGARLTAYYPNFYGDLTDGLNAGVESDRLLVTWVPGAVGVPESAVAEALDGADVTAAVSVGRDGRPQIGDATGPLVMLAVPRDIIRLRASDPHCAREWREAVRSAMPPLLARDPASILVTKDSRYLFDFRRR